MPSDPPAPGPWAGWRNAAVYASFAREGRVYGTLNRRLVALAEISSANRVLDLACGTGATARACLEVLPRDGELVGIDASEAMVAMARAEIADPRASFEVAAAARLGTVVTGSFDRAVCCAAFWQFPSRTEVLRAVARVLAPGALFSFNLPGKRFAGSRVAPDALRAAVSRALDRRGIAPERPSPIDAERLAVTAAEEGFELLRRVEWSYRGPLRELLDLYRIPAMIGRLAPGLEEGEGQALLDEVAVRIALDETTEVPWVDWLLRKRSD